MLVHAWITYLTTQLVPRQSSGDLLLYAWWTGRGLTEGTWPVLDEAWVYPAGALVPLLGAHGVAGLAGLAYPVAWCVLVTVLNAAAVVVLTRPGAGSAAPPAGATRSEGSLVGAWWWVAFLLLLGPVALARLDAVVAPLVVVALVVAGSRPRLAAALLAVGAWVKVAPGAVLVPLALHARRPWRDVVAPAALVTLFVLVALGIGGGLSRSLTFLVEQTDRALQVEAVGATPWVLASLVTSDVRVVFDQVLVTFEVVGPGAVVGARVLGVLLVVGAVASAALLWWARARGADVLLWGALLVLTVLFVANKVGSPQYVGWLAPPVAVALTLADPPVSRRVSWRTAAWLVLGIAGVTQVLYPFAYGGVISSSPLPSLLLAVRNVALVAVLVLAVAAVLARLRAATPVGVTARGAGMDPPDGGSGGSQPPSADSHAMR